MKILSFTLLLLSSATMGQTVVETEISGQPLQYMKDGNIEGCGLRMLAGRPMPLRGVQFADVSLSVYGNGLVIFKATSAEMPQLGAKPIDVKVAAGWVRPHRPATKPLGKTKPGDDGRSLLYQADFEVAMSIFDAEANSDPIQIGVRRQQDSVEVIYSGVIAMSPAEQRSIANCFAALTK